MRLMTHLLIGAVLLAGCATETPDADQPDPAAKRVQIVESLLQGVWRWNADPRYELHIANGRSYYVSNGQADRDTAYYTLGNILCNPRAAYQQAAQIVSVKPIVYYETLVFEGGLKHKQIKRCWSIMAISQDSLKLFETQMGTVVLFHKAKS